MIYTVTLNPTVDRHFQTEDFVLFSQNRVKSERADMGGKGINLSRALTVSGCKNTAVVVLGEDGEADFCNKMKADGIEYLKYTAVGRRIRSNIIIHSPGKPETRLSTDDFRLSDGELAAVASLFSPTAGDIVAVSGRMPKGLSEKAVGAFLLGIKEKGALLVLDSSSFSADFIAFVHPWLIKPNRDEAESLGIGTSAEKGLRLAENVLISLDRDGAVYGCRGFTAVIKVPVLSDPVSTTGAGDSTLAGFIKAFSEGKTAVDCLKTALAFGTASCLTEGTLPPRPEDVKRIFGEAIVDSKRTEN